MKKIFKIIAPFTLLFLVQTAFGAEQFVKNKTLQFASKYSEGMYVDLSNQYGDIEVTSSNTDSIKITVYIEVNAKKEENLQSTLDNIAVDFKSGLGFFTAQTRWKENVDFFTKSYYAVKTGVISSDDNLVVNYKIELPIKTELNINNKFGNVYLENHEGRMSVSVFHGDFRAKDLKHLKDLEVKFGKVKINKLENSQMNFTSVKFADIAQANSISLNSISSEIEIGTIETLVLDSKHDELDIQNCGELTGQSSLSDIKINYLRNNFKIDAKLGSIRVQECQKTLLKFEVKSYRTDVSIGFSNDVSASIELLIDDKKYLYTGLGINKLSENPSTENQLKMKFEKGSGAFTLINIASNNAYIELGK